MKKKLNENANCKYLDTKIYIEENPRAKKWQRKK